MSLNVHGNHTPAAAAPQGIPPVSQVILALVAGLALRLIGIDGRAMWYDEAFAVLFSQKGLGAMLYGTLTTTNGAAADVHPLLYYFTLDGWMRIFGARPEAVRWYSVMVSLAGLLILYLLARRLFGHPAAIAALLIAAVSPFAVQYGQEARMYALLVLLLLSATYCFVRGAQAEGRAIGWWAAFGVAAGLAMYTQQLAGFYLVALGLAGLTLRGRNAQKGLIFGVLVALIVYGPWLIQLPAQFGKVGAYWIEKPGIPELLLTLRTFVFVDMDVPSVPALILSLVAGLLTVAFLIVGALPVLTGRRGGPPAARFGLALALWLAVAPPALMWIVSQARPVYLNRALLPSAYAFYLALGWLLARPASNTPLRTQGALPRPIAGLVSGALALSALFGLAAFAGWQTFPRGQFAQVVAMLRNRAQEGTAIIHANKITAIPFAYYDQIRGTPPTGAPEQYIADPPGSATDTLAPATQAVLGLPADPCIGTAAGGRTQVFYIKFDRQGDADLPWLRAHYAQESAAFYNDLTVYTFDVPDAVARAGGCEATR